jgi:hypothetical protein
LTPPDVIYVHPDGATYLARFEDDDDIWWRWPAEAHGWQRRVRCPEAMADACSELEPRLAWLALRLSGVPTDA